jgi:hypothetical protein
MGSRLVCWCLSTAAKLLADYLQWEEAWARYLAYAERAPGVTLFQMVEVCGPLV